jgi:hypothetical protein
LSRTDLQVVTAALERLADAVERLAGYYALVHNLNITECPECHQRPDQWGQIYHVSGCPSLWPDPAKLHIPGEGL